MENSEETSTWETRRQKLIKMLKDEKFTIDLRMILRELEYPNKHALINDVSSIIKTLNRQNIKVKIVPPSCIACGFEFKLKKDMIKIPSKCPKCREQRIDWPMLSI